MPGVRGASRDGDDPALKFTADEEFFLQHWDGPALTRRAIKVCVEGRIATMSGLRRAIKLKRLKWITGCGHITERELLIVAADRHYSENEPASQ
jgi:hypothetical protein